MRMTAAIGLAVLVMLTGGFAPEVEASPGARPLAFTLPAVPGGPTRGRFQLAEHLGRRPVVLLFWATWCEPCKQELPFYQRLYERYRDRGLIVAAISMDDANGLASAGSTARRLGITFPVLSDLDTAVASRMNPRHVAPFSVYIDRRGRIAREKEGFNASERESITRAVENLL